MGMELKNCKLNKVQASIIFKAMMFTLRESECEVDEKYYDLENLIEEKIDNLSEIDVADNLEVIANLIDLDN